MFIGMCVVACVFVLGADLPEGFEQLQSLTKDEAALIQEMRSVDVRETALAEAELQEAREKADAGDKEGAAAKQSSASKRFERIRTGYEYVVRQYPDNARIQTYYGELLYDRFGDMAGALRAWQLASSLDPKYSLPLNDLAIHYCHNGDYVRGINCYDRAIKLDPSVAEYLFNLAQTYLTNFPIVQQIRKWDKPRVYREAMKLSKRAKELAPDDHGMVQDYAVNFFAGEDFGVKVNWKEAAKAWQDTRPLARSNDERFFTWLNEARVWIRAVNKTRATECLTEALKLHPDNDVALKLLNDLGPDATQPGKASKGKNKQE